MGMGMPKGLVCDAIGNGLGGSGVEALAAAATAMGSGSKSGVAEVAGLWVSRINSSK